jgi:hypothetical protein
MLARNYIEKLIASSQCALEHIDKGGEQGIRLSLGDLDYAESHIQAAKILLREELKEMKN